MILLIPLYGQTFKEHVYILLRLLKDCWIALPFFLFKREFGFNDVFGAGACRGAKSGKGADCNARVPPPLLLCLTVALFKLQHLTIKKDTTVIIHTNISGNKVQTTLL